MAKTKLNDIFRNKLNELNKRRKAQDKPSLNKSDLAIEIFPDDGSNRNSKAQRLSNCLSGKMEFKAIELRRIRKIFRCTIDELYPVSEDIDIVINL